MKRYFFTKSGFTHLLLISFFSVTMTTAMDDTTIEPVELMRQANAALDIIKYSELEDKAGQNHLFFCKDLEEYFAKTNRADLFAKYRALERADLLNLAEKALKQALDLHHPYAAVTLSQIYTKSGRKDAAIEVLRRSIEFKRTEGTKTGFDADVDALMEAEDISCRSVEGIARIEPFDVCRAIRLYASLTYGQKDGVSEDESIKALAGLLRHQGNKEAWLHLARAYKKRHDGEQVLFWLEKLANSENAINLDVLSVLLTSVSDAEIPLQPRFELAKYAHEYVTEKQPEVDVAFPAHLAYYKVLSDLKAQGRDCAGDIIKLGGLLAQIGFNHLKTNPQLLYQFAESQEVEATRSGDWLSVIDSYQKCASEGCHDAVQKLSAMPQLFHVLGRVEATLFLIQHLQTDRLFELYCADRNMGKAYILILQWILEQRITWVPKEYEIKCEIKSLLSPSQDDVVRNYDNALTHAWLDVLRKASSQLHDKLFTVDETSLSAEELFNLAKEHQLLHRAAELICEYNKEKAEKHFGKYISLMEAAAQKGYLPAAEELRELFTNGYVDREYRRPWEETCYYRIGLKLSRETSGHQDPAKAEYYRQVVQAGLLVKNMLDSLRVNTLY